MSEEDSAEKTEEPSPERRRKAREEGQFPRAKDTGGVIATLFVLIALMGFGDSIGGALRGFLVECLSNPVWLLNGDVNALGQRTAETLATATLPIAVCAALAAIGAGLLEAGFQPRVELAMPKWNRLDPTSKLKQLFSLSQGTSNLLLALGRVAAVLGVTLLVMRHHFEDLIQLSRAPVSASSGALAQIALNFAIWATGTLMILTAIDYVVSWFRHEKSIRMSRRELKDELNQQEGDPRVKAKLRARAREIATKGLAHQIKQSDVVVTNPTHIAVALRYRANEGAPVINAKGFDEVAQYIKTLAKEHHVTVIENKALARALAKNGRVGKVIPFELYAAVAQVLAMVYRTKRRAVA
jgi:flagellar biosynthesis protein FlhB